MLENKKDVIYLITDRRGLEETAFYTQLEELLKAGVDLLQLREKSGSTAEMLDVARRVGALAKKYKVPYIIDDRIDICLAVNADGVHVGADDMPVEIARSLLGKDKMIGATAKSVEEAKRAQEDGADYLGVGAIYDTATHDHPVRTTVETVAEIVRNVDIPVYGIGGLRADNLSVLEGSGVRGACFVSFLMQSKEIRKDIKDIREALRNL